MRIRVKTLLILLLILIPLFLTGCTFGTFDINLNEPIKIEYVNNNTIIPKQNISISINLHKEKCTDEMVYFCSKKDMVCINNKCEATK